MNIIAEILLRGCIEILANDNSLHNISQYMLLSSVLRPRQHSIGYMEDGF